MLKEQVAGDVVARHGIGRHVVGRLVVGGGFVVQRRVVGLGRRDVLHHQVAARIANPQWLAFGVELGKGQEAFVQPRPLGQRRVAVCRVAGRCAVVRDGDDFAAEAVEVNRGRRVGVQGSEPRGTLVYRRCLLRLRFLCRIGVHGIGAAFQFGQAYAVPA